MSPLLTARGVRKSFLWRGRASGTRRLVAVDDVDLDVERGECLALVGESGSGKTTLGRCLLRLVDPDAGTVRFAGMDLTRLRGKALRRRRTQFQMVFQNAADALDPRMRVGDLLAEPLRIHRLAAGAELAARVDSLLRRVGLATALAGRYPHQLSGGQRQRVNIARALATEPRLLILDEPVSALDVSVRAQILVLLADLQRRLDLTMILIAHDLAMVEQIADRVAVLYLGRVVERGDRAAVFARPMHPYTEALLRSVPIPDPEFRGRRQALGGEIPSPLRPPPGCPFHPRCPLARELPPEDARRCVEERPPLRDLDPSRAVACHFAPPPGSGS